MQDRARCHRGLPAAPLALPQPPARQLEGLGHPTVPAAKAVGPPARRQVLSTRVVIPALGLDLLQRLGEIWQEIGREACRGRECQYGWTLWDTVSIKKKKIIIT